MRVPSTGDKLPLSTRRGTRRARVVAVGPRSSAVARVVVVAIVFYCEVWAFRRAASRCEWADTGQDAVRLLVGADPQLIDYATSYPQRNALLRWLTVVLTDVYAKKSWRWAVYESKPDAIVWLGDLLDAGRSFVATNERTYAKEAHRFHSVFPVPLDEHLDRRTVPLIVVPGNHDVSIYTGDGINAFERYFGQAHSVHSMAGWEIVAIDAVSLVAGSQQERDWIVGLPSTHHSLHRFRRLTAGDASRARQAEDTVDARAAVQARGHRLRTEARVAEDDQTGDRLGLPERAERARQPMAPPEHPERPPRPLVRLYNSRRISHD